MTLVPNFNNTCPTQSHNHSDHQTTRFLNRLNLLTHNLPKKKIKNITRGMRRSCTPSHPSLKSKTRKINKNEEEVPVSGDRPATRSLAIKRNASITNFHESTEKRKPTPRRSAKREPNEKTPRIVPSLVHAKAKSAINSIFYLIVHERKTPLKFDIRPAIDGRRKSRQDKLSIGHLNWHYELICGRGPGRKKKLKRNIINMRVWKKIRHTHTHFVYTTWKERFLCAAATKRSD